MNPFTLLEFYFVVKYILFYIQEDLELQFQGFNTQSLFFFDLIQLNSSLARKD